MHDRGNPCRARDTLMRPAAQGRIRELEEIRAELAEKELVLLGKEQELLERDQTLAVLREEVRGCRPAPHALAASQANAAWLRACLCLPLRRLAGSPSGCHTGDPHGADLCRSLLPR